MRSTGRVAIALVLACCVLGIPPVAASGEPPTAELVTIAVTAWGANAPLAAAPASAVDGVVSRPVVAPDTVMVGAEWAAQTGVSVEVRALGADGWGAWATLDADSDHAPDPGSAEAARVRPAVSQPVWVGRSRQVQVRVRGQDVPAVTLHTVRIRGGDGLSYVPPQLAGGDGVAAAMTEDPEVLPRSTWDPKGQCTPQHPPHYSTDVRFAVVHHTADTNIYSASEADDRILSACIYHVRSQGYDDIAYNFLVDRYGRSYEGRAGGIREAVQGGHTLGFNGGSTGIALVGNFDGHSPPAVTLHALRDLLAWKLDVHHVDPHGSVTEISGDDTGVYDEDEIATFDTIVGHRDLRTTACPGGEVYRYISSGWLAARVAETGLPKVYGGPPAFREQSVMGVRPRWNVTFSRPSGWRLTLRDERGAIVRRGEGEASAIDLRWDMLDAEGNEVRAGRYTATLRLLGRSARPIVTTFEVTNAVSRRSGDDRIATAVELSRWAFRERRRAHGGFALNEEVVIASSESAPDALVASPLAGAIGAPVLLTGGGSLSPLVAAEVRRLGATEAYIVGGTTRLSEHIERDLREHTSVRTIERLSGPTRYDTAAAVAAEIVRLEGPDEVLLALGDHPDPSRAFPDALAAGAFGATFDVPVLLVTSDSLPEATERALTHHPSGDGDAPGPWADSIKVFGGTAAISAEVEEAAGRAAEATTSRFAGTDRYDTARLAADAWLRRRAAEPDDPAEEYDGLEVVFATGTNWPDALGAGAAAAERGALFLLVHGRSLHHSGATRAWLREHAAEVVRGVVAGGSAAVADQVMRQIEALVRSAGPHLARNPRWGRTDLATG